MQVQLANILYLYVRQTFIGGGKSLWHCSSKLLLHSLHWTVGAWAFLSCLLNAPDVLKSALHFLHLYGLSSEWLLLCCLKWVGPVKLFPHVVHTNGLSPVWVRSWSCKLRSWVKLLKHLVHSNVFFPVWVLVSWLFNSGNVQKLLPHSAVHLKDFSSVWVFSCFLKLFALA